ncbi:MAG: hypothetical protein COA36_14050 [Desulfotalea sp.]|nr:MAG: hypothetical protein COA36_14050 [Desulfotalea sp.]
MGDLLSSFSVEGVVTLASSASNSGYYTHVVIKENAYFEVGALAVMGSRAFKMLFYDIFLLSASM